MTASEYVHIATIPAWAVALVALAIVYGLYRILRRGGAR